MQSFWNVGAVFIRVLLWYDEIHRHELYVGNCEKSAPNYARSRRNFLFPFLPELDILESFGYNQILAVSALYVGKNSSVPIGSYW